MAVKSGRSKAGTKKLPGRARKSVKRPAKHPKTSAKRGSVSAKKAASKRPKKSATGRRKKSTRASQGAQPKFFIMFKKAGTQDIYHVAVYDDNRLTSSDLITPNTLNDLEQKLGALDDVTVEFAHLLEENADIFRTCGPSPPFTPVG